MKGKTSKKIAFLAIIILLLEFNFTINVSAQTLQNIKSPILIKITPKDSIQETIDQAPINSIILLEPGIYNEILNIKKSISLIGGKKENTIINPVSEENKYAIRLGAPNIILKNLSIKNGAPGIYTTAIKIIETGSKIINCDIYDTPVGIAVWTSNNIIENCKFWNCKDEGIALIGSTISECKNNKILNSTFFNNCDAIELQHASNNIIENCALLALARYHCFPYPYFYCALAKRHVH